MYIISYKNNLKNKYKYPDSVGINDKFNDLYNIVLYNYNRVHSIKPSIIYE